MEAIAVILIVLKIISYFVEKDKKAKAALEKQKSPFSKEKECPNPLTPTTNPTPLGESLGGGFKKLQEVLEQLGEEIQEETDEPLEKSFDLSMPKAQKTFRKAKPLTQAKQIQSIEGESLETQGGEVCTHESMELQPLEPRQSYATLELMAPRVALGQSMDGESTEGFGTEGLGNFSLNYEQSDLAPPKATFKLNFSKNAFVQSLVLSEVMKRVD